MLKMSPLRLNIETPKGTKSIQIPFGENFDIRVEKEHDYEPYIVFNTPHSLSKKGA